MRSSVSSQEAHKGQTKWERHGQGAPQRAGEPTAMRPVAPPASLRSNVPRQSWITRAYCIQLAIHQKQVRILFVRSGHQ